ncbi:DUF3667 domain-containing protein [Tenacibaculum amylolyticum]|uniref:DUF3667 domain-containing protein n=1 Tax=Tenacibaculum amylolyticum TaxID=104269 RepID=UPI0038949817
MICISCDYQHEEKFCPNCGEKGDIPKITFSSTISNAFLSITNMDKGFLYNLKNLTLSPKVTIEAYLKGKRKQIFNPISFLIIAVTAYLLLASLLKTKPIFPNEKTSLIQESLINKSGYEIGASAGKIIFEYFKFFWVFTIIPLSLFTKLFFKRYNFAENLAINSFILGHVTLIIGSISFIIFKFPILINPFIYLGLIWYLYRVFGNKKYKSDSLIMAFTTIFFFIISLISIIIIIGLFNLS